MDDLNGIDPPKCPNCMTSCVRSGTTSHPFWACPDCRTAILNR